MGASSLVLCAVGYGVGRFRELRDPAHGLLPIAVGAAAAAGWVLAFGAVSFMLDVGAASVSGLVFREMIVTVILDTLIALPVFGLVRRVIRPAPGRRPARAPPAPPEPARERAARPAGHGGLMYLDGENRRVAHAPARLPRGAHRRHRAGGLRGHLLPPLVPPGALGRPVRGQGQRQPRARDQGAGAARRGRGPRRPRAGGQPHRPGREGHPRQAARRARASAWRSTSASAGVLGSSARRIDRSVSDQLKALPYSAATVKQDVKPNVVAYLLERQKELPGRRPWSACSCASTRTSRSAPTCSAPSARSPRSSSRTSATAAWAWATAWASRASSTSTTASCAARTAPRACRWTRWAASRASCRCGGRFRAASCACRWTSASSAWASRRWAAPRARSRS